MGVRKVLDSKNDRQDHLKSLVLVSFDFLFVFHCNYVYILYSY